MIKKITYISIMVVTAIGCNKFLEVDGINDRLLPAQVFASDEAANTAIAGIYRTWFEVSSSRMSVAIFTGLAADELMTVSSSPSYLDFYENNVRADNGFIPWADYYNIIYQCTAALESLEQSEGVTPHFKRYYSGEARAIRAYCYFMLANLFGDVPLLLTTDIEDNAAHPRDNEEDIFDFVADELAASRAMLQDPIFPAGDDTRLNVSVIDALTARVALYRGDWNAAKQYAGSVIDGGVYHLVEDLDSISLANNSEAIFQFAAQPSDANPEARGYYEDFPNIVCDPSMPAAFAADDRRKIHWLVEAQNGGTTFFYPDKFKNPLRLPGQLYTLLRLGEMYLIRAEANARTNDITSAVADINVLRSRAATETINMPISADSCENLIMNERRLELFAESGHRWFDLKRTGQLNTLMEVKKMTTWDAHEVLWPIPSADLNHNPKLVQNPGYK